MSQPPQGAGYFRAPKNWKQRSKSSLGSALTLRRARVRSGLITERQKRFSRRRMITGPRSFYVDTKPSYGTTTLWPLSSLNTKPVDLNSPHALAMGKLIISAAAAR